MRILQVIHQFPPYSSQGSEVYCFNLSKQLNETDDVRVFHISNVARNWRRRLSREAYAGLSTYHCVDGAEYSRAAAWPNEILQKSFRTVLEEFSPDIVHLHNYLSLGDDLASLARASGAVVVYTLHDFGLICPNTLLFRTDGKLCTKEDANFFQDCCPILIRTNRTVDRAPWTARLPSLARWRLYGSQYPNPPIRTLLLSAIRAVEFCLGQPRFTDVGKKREFFFTHTRRIFADVDLFLAPSQFLLERYVSCGLPSTKIVHMRYGMRSFSQVAGREPSGQIRFGYIGALHPHKGIELLLEAFRGLGERASLHVHGSTFNSPVSQNYWRRIREQQGSNVVFHGAYDNDRIGEVFARIDVVVVPSLWYENSPLTIQEAFIFAVPVITADRGGMAELVRDGIDGLHFRLGDALDLQKKMLQIIEQPEMVDRLRRGIQSVTSMDKHANALRATYQQLHDRAKGG